jgi:VWFA-related protein
LEIKEACGLSSVLFTEKGVVANLFGSGLNGIVRALLCLLTFAAVSLAQNSTTPATPPVPPTSQTPDASQPKDDQKDDFVFKKEVEEVVLHAIVADGQNHLVTGLDRSNFTVFEDGKQQEVTSFRKERVPVALGILIDNSGSMLPKRAKVNEAALQLVGASQPEDRVFVVNFGEDAFLDQDYTPDVVKLRAALQRVETRGSTALYDAIIGAVNHLNRTSPVEKKVLLVVTDGRDNASQATFQEVLRKLQAKNGPVLYTIALEQAPERAEKAEKNDQRDNGYRQSLSTLSAETGGTAFFPSSLDEVQSIAGTIARDIRSQYVIGYRSSNPHTPGVYHAIQVQALEGSTRLRVATRAGYYSGNAGSPGPQTDQSH